MILQNCVIRGSFLLGFPWRRATRGIADCGAKVVDASMRWHDVERAVGHSQCHLLSSPLPEAINGNPGAHAPRTRSFFGYFFFKKSNFFP